MRKMKRVEDSRTENTYLIMKKHINCYGRLFGGVLMQNHTIQLRCPLLRC